MQKAKVFFYMLVTAGHPVLLEDFNLVTSLETKAKPLSYADLHSHLLMYELLHKTSLTSMGSAAQCTFIAYT